jgi:hypothetical protein
MKKILLGSVAVVCLSATLVFSIYDSLKITQGDAKDCLVLSIGSGLLNEAGHSGIVSSARQLSSAEKVEGIRQLIQLAREYTATDEFAKAYKKWRNEMLNPRKKGKLGIPRLGKMIDDKINGQLDKMENGDKYPSDPVKLVKKRLKEFLDISSSVDFDAELTATHSFVKPEYERKSNQWKMCYRAGKDVVDAARVEAQNWLDALNGQ